MGPRKSSHVLMCLFAAATLAAPAFAEEASEVQAKPYPEGVNCIWSPQSRAQGFFVIDDQHLVVEQPFRKHYLITLTRKCWNLDTVNSLGFSARGNQICGPGDSVVTDRDRCMIAYIEEVPNYEAAKAIVAGREEAEDAARVAKRSGGN